MVFWCLIWNFKYHLYLNLYIIVMFICVGRDKMLILGITENKPCPGLGKPEAFFSSSGRWKHQARDSSIFQSTSVTLPQLRDTLWNGVTCDSDHAANPPDSLFFPRELIKMSQRIFYFIFFCLRDCNSTAQTCCGVNARELKYKYESLYSSKVTM